jgi:hypothetical protein
MTVGPPGLERYHGYAHVAPGRLNGDPTLFHTDGPNEPIYGAPHYSEPFDIHHDLLGFSMNMREAPFGEYSALDIPWNKALWNLEDMGILADALRMKQEDAQRRFLRGWEHRVIRLEQFAQEERRAYASAKARSDDIRNVASRRLIRAKAKERVLEVIDTLGLEAREDTIRRKEYLTHEGQLPPRLEAGQGPSRGRARRRMRCGMCGFNGHQSRNCDTPHYKCSYEKKGYCLVDRRHNHYRLYRTIDQDCPYKGQNKKDGKRRERMEVVTDAQAQDQGDTLQDEQHTD